jgi:predicted Zn-dependent protease
MLLQQSRWEEALREFDAVRQESPGAKRVEINRATALDRLGRSDEAMRALETALRALYAEARGTGRPPVEELTYCHELAGDIERRRGRFEAAVQQYEAALRLAPGHPRVRQKLGALREGP